MISLFGFLSVWIKIWNGEAFIFSEIFKVTVGSLCWIQGCCTLLYKWLLNTLVHFSPLKTDSCFWISIFLCSSFWSFVVRNPPNGSSHHSINTADIKKNSSRKSLCVTLMLSIFALWSETAAWKWPVSFINYSIKGLTCSCSVMFSTWVPT